MPYIEFTENQKQRAAAVDLEAFLRSRGERLLHEGRDRRLASDHSVTICGNEWYDHAVKEGGGPITFVQNFYGLSYPEAMTCLLNGEQGEIRSAPPKARNFLCRPKMILCAASTPTCSSSAISAGMYWTLLSMTV